GELQRWMRIDISFQSSFQNACDCDFFPEMVIREINNRKKKNVVLWGFFVYFFKTVLPFLKKSSEIVLS
ncbi:hypothetical protein, partial [Escherichia coli]|uniref:hypothetical protein n=1 Tax=Escherichia coli TaxID=562 RepID=UPI001F3CC25D